MTIYEFTEWRYRLGLTRVAAAELLGIHEVTLANWELGKRPIDKTIQLAALACEFAYIAADQHIKTRPVTTNNNSHKYQCEAIGRRYIRDGIINGRNPINGELLIILPPKSLIHRQLP